MTTGEQIIAWGGVTVIFFLGIAIAVLCVSILFEFPKWTDIVWKSMVSVEMLVITITMIFWLWNN